MHITLRRGPNASAACVQLYWPTTQTAQAFGKLVAWWTDLSKGSARSIFVRHDATKAGAGALTLAEYDAQMRLARAERGDGVRGSVFFSAKPLVSDQAGLRTALATTQFAQPALTPPLALAAGASALPEPTGSFRPRRIARTGPCGCRFPSDGGRSARWIGAASRAALSVSSSNELRFYKASNCKCLLPASQVLPRKAGLLN